MKSGRNAKYLRILILLTALTMAAIYLLAGCAPGTGSESLPTAANTYTPAPDSENNKETANPGSNSETAGPGMPAADTEDEIRKNTDAEITKEPEIVSVTISAAGDCTLGVNSTMSYEDSFDAVYDRMGKSYFFRKVYDIFSKDDFTIVNLEGPLTRSKDMQPKLYNHKGRPEYIGILTEGSVEAVSFSNNHTYDYGQAGYEDTVELLTKAGIAYACDEIYGMYETKGIKIGFVSVNQLYDGKLVEVWLKEGAAKLRRQGADLVIACIHWGSELGGKISHMDDYQIQLGNQCIDWGYDLVIGTHPHVLSGINKYKGKYIAYSLGNFCYGGSKNPKDKDSGIFQQTFTFVDGELMTDDNVRFIPCSISSDSRKNNYQPTVAAGEEARRITAKMNAYSAQYGVAFDSDGYLLPDITLTEQNKADAYYSIFKESFKGEKPIKSVKHIGVDLSELELPDTAYLEGLISKWCESNGYTAFFGTGEELAAEGYNKKAANGEAEIVIFDAPNWSCNQVQCRVYRNIRMLKYLRDIFTSAYVDGKWITVKDIYIQL